MPKTRHDHFVIAFNNFMDNIIYEHYPLLFEYKLNCITENKLCKRHTYTLHIPKKYLSYTISSKNDNTVNENVYTEQEIPDSDDIKILFLDYFNKHALVVDNNKLSYTDIFEYNFITDYFITDNSETELVDGINFIIFIYYYKSHIPFPIALTKMEELIERNK
jgi:hypothetical protein